MTSYFHMRGFVKTSIKTEGVIIRLVDYSPSKHYPVYVFRDPDKKWHQVYTDVLAKHSTSAARGDKVALIYQADRPGEAQRASFWNLWKRPVMLLGFGVLDLLFGAGVLLVARSQ